MSQEVGKVRDLFAPALLRRAGHSSLNYQLLFYRPPQMAHNQQVKYADSLWSGEY